MSPMQLCMIATEKGNLWIGYPFLIVSFLFLYKILLRSSCVSRNHISINYGIKKIFLLVGIALAIYVAFRFLLPLVVPFIIAGVVAVIYYPFLRKLYHNSRMWEGKKKKWLLVLSVVLFYIIVFVILCIFCTYLFGQCESIWLNFPFYQARFLGFVHNCCQQVDGFLRINEGTSFTYIEGIITTVSSNGLSGLLPKMTGYSIRVASKMFGFVFEVIVTVMATFFLIQDYDGLRENLMKTDVGKSVCNMVIKCKDTLKSYIKAQGLIMLLDGGLCTLAFWLIGQPYFLIFGPLVAVLDALPVLGAGIFLIPFALYLIVVGEIGKAFVIFLAYIGCVVIRQLTEPRMIGSKTGLRPIYTLLSMYVGFRLFGVVGFVLGPVGVLIGQEIYKMVNSNWLMET